MTAPAPGRTYTALLAAMGLAATVALGTVAAIIAAGLVDDVPLRIRVSAGLVGAGIAAVLVAPALVLAWLPVPARRQR